jgi:hypothetical protein
VSHSGRRLARVTRQQRRVCCVACIIDCTRGWQLLLVFMTHIPLLLACTPSVHNHTF